MAKGKKNGKQNGNGNGVGRNRRRAATGRTYVRGVTQGVGAVPPLAFGNLPLRSIDRVLNAFDPTHLPLPRAIGEYTVVRFTKMFTTTDEVLIFGPETVSRPSTGAFTFEAGNMTNIICRSSVNSAAAINGVANTRNWTLAMPLGDSSTLVPSAFSVQILNPEPLQTTTGIVMAGRSKMQLKLGDDGRAWLTLGDEFTQFMAPRLMSAGKLALRGVQIDGYPLNMSAASNLTPLDTVNDGLVTWDLSQTGTINNVAEPAIMTPIVVLNSGGVQLSYLVTMECRVRFDLSNPACSGHTLHHPASDATWATVIARASALGNGVIDIVQRTAETGAALANTAMMGVQVARASGMIGNTARLAAIAA